MSRHPEGSGHHVPEMLDMMAGMERIEADRYTGRDPDHLVTAVVDGGGIVAQIRFGATAAARAPEMVERAVLTAVAAAQRRAEEAWCGDGVAFEPTIVDTSAKAGEWRG